MKVEIGGVFNPYRKNVPGEKSSKSQPGGEAKKASGSEDVSDVRRGSTAIDDKSFSTVKAKLQSEINAPTSSERLEELRASIKNGTYRIPTSALVDAILGQ